MNIFAFSSLISFCLCLLLGNFVYHLNKKNQINKIFMLMCVSISYWAFTDFMILQAESFAAAYSWFKIGFLWPFSVALLFHFSLLFTGNTKILSKFFTNFLIYFPALFFSIFGLTTDLISGEPVKANGVYTYSIPENSLLFWTSSIWLFALGFLALLLCIRYYLKETGRKKKQAKFVSVAFSIPIVVSLASEFLPILSQFRVPDLSVISTTMLCIFVGYAIWKYELFALNPVTVAENIISTMPDSLILIDREGKILTVNQSLVNLLGYTEAELIGKSVDVLFKEEQFMSKKLERLFRKGGFKNHETRYKTKSNEEIPVSFSASVVRNKEGQINGAVVIVRDITENKRMEELLLKSEKLAAIGRAATMVGHDLRNPLQAIENAAYCIKNELKSINATNPIFENSLNMLEIMEVSIEYADNIVKDLKDFSSERKPVAKKVDINKIVRGALHRCKAPKNVEIITELNPLPLIEVDKDMIKRTFVNIVTNGMQAMQNGGTLEVSTKKTNGFIEVSFKDTGVGMSKEIMKQLFTPFFTTKAQGMGMGLAICKKFVDRNGGSIEVESEEGKGSIFTIKLPIQN